jgi:hypothetical protein
MSTDTISQSLCNIEDKIYRRDKGGCFVRVDSGQTSRVLGVTGQKVLLRVSVGLAEQFRVLKKMFPMCFN